MIKKLGEVCEILNGFAFQSKKYVSSGIRVIRIANVQDGRIEDKSPCFYPITYESELSRYMLRPGDLLMSLTGYVGRVGVLNADMLPAALNQRVACLRLREGIILMQYAYYYFQQKKFREDCNSSAKGAAQPNMSTAWLSEYEILIPPLAEQKRIVAKIDAAFEKIDKLKAYAEKNLANAKELFQAALDEAMRPKDGWVEKRLGEVGTTLTGMTPSTRDKSNFGNFMPFVKPADIMPFNPINYREEGLSQKGVSCSRLIKSDSVLMVCIGASIGKTGYADRDCTCNQQINALIPNGFDGRYLYYMLSSDKFKKKLMEDAGQATLPIINKSKWKNLSLCVSLSLSEQREIVNRLDLLAEKIKTIEQNYTQQIADCVEMRQAVLREAFEGRL